MAYTHIKMKHLVDFVKYAERFNKIIIIAGLDGDFNREPFGQILTVRESY